MTKTQMNELFNEISQSLLEEADMTALRSRSEEIRSSYRDKQGRTRDLEIRDEAGAQAYLAWRLPVTGMVIHEVMDRLLEAVPEFRPETFLDLGAGPAVSVLPVSLAFPSLRVAHLAEEQGAMRQAGQTVLKELAPFLSPEFNVSMEAADFLTTDLPESDLVLASYSINELNGEELSRFTRKLIALTRHIAVLIVPGTPEHFRRLTEVRSQLVAAGFSILAPCTFTGPCAMEEEADWCHFYTRVARSRLLRILKSGQMAYEDEKFSYLIVSRCQDDTTIPLIRTKELGRIIRHPLISKGFREVELCRAEGITSIRLSKGKHKEAYRQLKQKGWGDTLELNLSHPAISEE